MKQLWVIGIVVGLAMNVLAQQMATNVNMFSDIKSNQVGKGITVLVMEYSQARNDARTETLKDSQHDLGVAGGEGVAGILPDFTLRGKFRNDFRGLGRTTKRGVLKAKIAARIVGKNEAGDYIIEGKRVIEINSEKEVYILTGCVRPEDIMSDNTVYSYNIYDAHIVYKGKGEVSRGQRAGLLTRLLQWVF